MTTYNQNIPQNQTPSSAQQPIKDNFTTFATAFAINHQPMNTNYQGNHTFVNMKVQTENPIINEDVGTLFCKSVTNAQGVSNQIFYNYASYTGKPFNSAQLTYNSIIYSGTQQQTFYLGGYVVYFGTLNMTGTSITVNLTPNSSGLFFASANFDLINTGSTANYLIGNISSTNQVIFTSRSTYTGPINYLIIGQQ